MTTSKTESKAKTPKMKRTVLSEHPRLVVETVAPVRPRSKKVRSVKTDPPYQAQIMTFAQAKELADQINDHWRDPSFVKADVVSAGAHGIVILKICLDFHGVKLTPVKVTLHFAPMMVHILDMVTIAYNTAASAVSQTRQHAGDVVRSEFLAIFQKYEQ